MLKVLNHIAKELLAPPFCVHCQRPFTFLCENCYQQTPFLSAPIKHTFEFLHTHISMSSFNGVTKSLITALKYKGQKDVAFTIASMMHHTLYLPDVELMTAIPAHPRRLKRFGYNHMAVLAEQLASIEATPFVPVLMRTQTIAPQASVADKSERKKRQHQTMSVIEKKEKQVSLARSVLIIDDVFTTGATLEEAARALRACNPKLHVTGVTIASA